MGQTLEKSNGSANPNLEKYMEPDGMKAQQQRHDAEEVLVKGIPNQSKIEGDEEEMTKDHTTVSKKRKAS
jgi:hypothetical protein